MAFEPLVNDLPAHENSPDVALYDYIKDEVGFRLSDRLFDVKRQFDVAVDLGCNRGFVSRHIMADTVRRLHLVDISPTMLAQADSTSGVQVQRHAADEETFEMADDSVDAVVSSLSLHWVNDLPGCFARIRRCLRPDGMFIGALYGGETLFELRSALQLAEVERMGGIGPHVSPFTQVCWTGHAFHFIYSIINTHLSFVLTFMVKNSRGWCNVGISMSVK